MKRLFLFVLLFTGLSVCAQENSVLDSIKGQPLKMHRADLFFGETYFAPDAHLLTDDEIKTLLGPDLFDQFHSGRSSYYTGRTLKTVGWINFGVGLGFTAFELYAYDFNFKVFSSSFLTYLGIGTVIEGVVLVLIGNNLLKQGNNKLKGILEQYNKDGLNLTYSLSPTLMRCQIPQNQTALGMTFSINY